MQVRVVCGLLAVIASFCPSSALSSVDFPTLGRPTIAARPARAGSWLRAPPFGLRSVRCMAADHSIGATIPPSMGIGAVIVGILSLLFLALGLALFWVPFLGPMLSFGAPVL